MASGGRSKSKVAVKAAQKAAKRKTEASQKQPREPSIKFSDDLGVDYRKKRLDKKFARAWYRGREFSTCCRKRRWVWGGGRAASRRWSKWYFQWSRLGWRLRGGLGHGRCWGADGVCKMACLVESCHNLVAQILQRPWMVWGYTCIFSGVSFPHYLAHETLEVRMHNPRSPEISSDIAVLATEIKRNSSRKRLEDSKLVSVPNFHRPRGPTNQNNVECEVSCD